MRFAVIEGSREWSEPGGADRPAAAEDRATIEDVDAEAQRRLRTARLAEWRTREFITGRAMPDEVRHYALQVGHAAEAIGRLNPIPADFDSDVYWPRLWY